MDRTPDVTPTVDLGPGGDASDPEDVAVPEAASAFDPPRERFEARGEIGRGGMGRVDDAFDRGLGRPVAIKHMLSTAPVDLARFEREARITARLEHPGIVPIHDAGRNRDGTPYYVMRRVDGQPLDQRVTASLAERLALIPNVLAACDAVGFAHARGVVHRDIKPTNILVGPFGETLVIDWGLARESGEGEVVSTTVPSTDRDLTRAGTVAGTPGFMAPEQARGEPVDARADVFALGATLYYVLAGQSPYGTISATEMIDLAGAGRSPDWRALPADTPPELRAIAMKAMASEAERRYADASALAADLRRFITGNLVGAYEYSPIAKLARFVRRHRAAMAVAAISAIVVVVGAVVSVRRVVSERDDANAARAIAEQRQRDTKSVSDRLLVQHALDLAADDPIATISMLRKLSPDSPRWAEARTAAAAAYVNGIPFGFRSYADIDHVEIERGSRYAFVMTRFAGNLDVFDLVARTRRFVTAVGDHPMGSAWLGAAHVVVAFEDHVSIVDVATGRKRVLPIATRYIRGDRGGSVWMLTPDRRLLELTDPAGEPRELSRDIYDFELGRTTKEAMVRHGDNVELWLGDKHFVLEVSPERRDVVLVGAVRGNRAAVLANNTVRMWHVDGDTVIDDGTVVGDKKNFLLSIDIVGEKYLSQTTQGLTQISNAGPAFVLDSGQGLNFKTPSGVVVIAHSGLLRLVDERGVFTFGSRAAGMKRADASTDGRFVVVTAASSVLFWDLQHVYPRTYKTEGDKQFVRMTTRYLWLDSNDGLSRIDLATGHEEEIVAERFMSAPSMVDAEDRYAVVHGYNSLELVDMRRGKHFIVSDVACVNGDEDQVVMVRTDGVLFKWRIGMDAPQRFGSFDTRDKPCQAVAAAGNRAIAVWPDHLEELDLATSRTRHYAVKEVESYALQPDGRYWFNVLNAGMWWWDVGEQPVRAKLPIEPDDMRIDRGNVLLFSQSALALNQGGTWHVVTHPASSFSWAGDARVAVLSATGDVDVIDMASELSFRMPVHRVQHLSTFGQRVALAANRDIMIWTIDVPDDPRQLQDWLRTVTNAQPVANSDAYNWP